MIKSSLAIRTCSSLMILFVISVIYLRQDQNSIQYRHRIIRSAQVDNATTRSADGYKKIKVWVASITAVFIISAVGLLGVAVVPLVQKVFFSKIIQYLVALAVGTLTGDAFLHLLPHALLGAHEDAKVTAEDNKEFIAVMKGLVALSGVFLFFFAEKCLSMIYEFRAEKKAEEEEKQLQMKDSTRAEMRRVSSLLMNSIGSRRNSLMMTNKDSGLYRRLSRVTSSGIEDDIILTTGLSSRAMKSIDNLMRYADIEIDQPYTVPFSHDRHLFTVVDAEELSPVTPNGSDGDVTLQVPSVTYRPKYEEDKKKIVKVNVNEAQRRPTTDYVNDKIKDRTSSKVPGHSHEVPGSIAAVAWMVILGDGLHNFTDGLAIGVAFANTLAGGLSTAVAVFCHELPHELGDFAVLLKTGMKVKQALFYNVVSSILCFVGMFIGIALHNIENATSWIFAITAGTFIYIALVDMMPELNSVDVKLGESRIWHLIIQSVGLASGVGVMLLIAVYEKNIKAMLG